MLPREHGKSDRTIWKPLEQVVGESYLSDFMFMGEKQVGERAIFLYKHIFTRSYLNLDEFGGAYRYQGSTYIAVDLTQALVHAFGSVDIPRIADQFKVAVDVVELSRIYKYAGQVRLYFVILDPDIALWFLASICASGGVAQIQKWAERGQLLILDRPHLIPGLSDTQTEVLRTEEAYLVKPALNNFLSGVRKSINGILILRVLNESLSAFLKPGIETIFIPEDMGIDETVLSLQKGVPVDSLSMGKIPDITLRKSSLENLQGAGTDIVMTSSQIICKKSSSFSLDGRVDGWIAE